MTRSAPLTQTQIFEAADALTAQGQRPTVTSVRKIIGSGSYTTIDAGLEEWKAHQAAHQRVFIKEPVPTEIAEPAQQWVEEVWTIALEKANARLQSEREALEKARQELEASHHEAIALADQLNTDLEHYQQRCTLLEEEQGQLTETHQTALTRIQQLTLDVQGLNQRNGELSQELKNTQSLLHTERDKATALKTHYEAECQHLVELKSLFKDEKQQLITTHQQTIDELKTAYQQVEQQQKQRQAELTQHLTEKKQQLAQERDTLQKALTTAETALTEKSQECERLQGQLALLKEQQAGKRP
jgi:chromosome segregation ATPase